MFRRAAVFVAILAVLAGLASFWTSSPPPPPPVVGRNNTVLFLTDSSNGLSNSHIASATALLKKYPEIEVHWGSFHYPPIGKRLERTSSAIIAKQPKARPINFREFQVTSIFEGLENIYPHLDGFILRPGLPDNDKQLEIIEDIFFPPLEAYYGMYEAARQMIEDTDPAVVVVDSPIRAFVDATMNTNRLYTFLNPNALTDTIAVFQPKLAVLWKYPAFGSGLPFPIPWGSIWTNMKLQVRFFLTLLRSPVLASHRKILAERGIKDPVNLSVLQTGVPFISGDLPEAGLPLDYYPEEVKVCGPMVVDSAPAEEQDPEMVQWLSQAPTIMVILGNNVRYTEARATAMARALGHVLDTTGSQVLWKMRKQDDFDDAWRAPLDKHIADGRIRMYPYIEADPVSLVKTGHIDVWVHHGGANCYFESALSGIKQVILPLWFDLYNFAVSAEYNGIGIWPGKDTAPVWDHESIAKGIMAAHKGEKAEAMQRRANDVKEAAKKYGGPECAAEIIADLARKGK